MTWWTHLSPGQGSLLAGICTAIGAVLGIVIAGKFFSGKVKTLNEALATSQTLLEEHARAVAATLEVIRERISILDAQTGSLASGLGRIEANTVELTETAENPSSPAPEDPWDTLRTLWFEIRDELERRASDERIDGRTRAAYGRIDRRQYYLLIEKMTDRGSLGPRSSSLFRDALALWQGCKSGRAPVRSEDVEKMRGLRDRLVKAA